MKKIVFIALILTFAFSLLLSYEQVKHDELLKLNTLEREFATPFMIPEHPKLADPQEIYPLLRKAAETAEINLFRVGRYFSPEKHIEITKYLLLTGETNFYDHVELAEGRTLRGKETWDRGLFLSSSPIQSNNQVGQILYFDPEQRISIQSLQASYDYLPVHGRYFAEARTRLSYLFQN